MTDNALMPTLIITRHKQAANEFASLFETKLQKSQIIVDPIFDIEYTTPPPQPRNNTAYIFTSTHGIFAVGKNTQSDPPRAYCVGDKTANIAISMGYDAISASGNAQDLIYMIKHAAPKNTTFLHIRGQYSTGEIAQSLNNAGIHCKEHIAYKQINRTLSKNTLLTFSRGNTIILPLFSTRSAMLLTQQIDQLNTAHVIAMSHSVAGIFHEKQVKGLTTIEKPTLTHMKIATYAAIDGYMCL